VRGGETNNNKLIIIKIEENGGEQPSGPALSFTLSLKRERAEVPGLYPWEREREKKRNCTASLLYYGEGPQKGGISSIYSKISVGEKRGRVIFQGGRH